MVPVDSETRSLAHKARLSLRKMKEFSLPLLPPATVADYLRRRRDMSAGMPTRPFGRERALKLRLSDIPRRCEALSLRITRAAAASVFAVVSLQMSCHLSELPRHEQLLSPPPSILLLLLLSPTNVSCCCFKLPTFPLQPLK